MGIAKLNVWISDVANPCGTWQGDGLVTVFDCSGILQWPCGRYLAPDGHWEPVPRGGYQHIPFRCGHLEVEVPPGCYWIIAGYIHPGPKFIHLNYTTHVGITEVGCGETACVKLYNPTLRLCWNWFRIGLRRLTLSSTDPAVQPDQFERLDQLVNEMLGDIPDHPAEAVILQTFEDLFEAARDFEFPND